MRKEDLRAGWLIESKENGLEMLMPIEYFGKETLALVSDLKSDLCQQIHTYDPFKEKTVLKVYGLPTNHRVWDEISTDDRPILWECKTPKKTVTLELTEDQIEDLEKQGFNVKS